MKLGDAARRARAACPFCAPFLGRRVCDAIPEVRPVDGRASGYARDSFAA